MPPGPALCPLAGAVLVGGASRRMGRDKASLPWDGVPMGARVAAALREAGCVPVVAVGGRPDAHGVLGVELVPDRFPGEGPLGAIVTALDVLAGRHVAVVACDMPWVSAEVIGSLAAESDARGVDVVVAHAGAPEPLLAIWSPSAARPMADAFAAGERSVRAALGFLRVAFVAVPGDAVRNVNSPGDVSRQR